MASQEEIDVYKETFDLFDLNKDGTVDVEELGIGFEKSEEYNLRLSVGTLTQLVNSFDVNNDNVLQFEEFVALLKSKELEDIFQRESEKITKPQIIDLDETYGQTPTPTENPAFIKQKLDELKHEIKRIPATFKNGSIQAENKCPDLAGDDFKIVFLRCEVFNAQAAAKRWVSYWDKRLEIFGPEKAFLPLTVAGALKDDKEILSLGHLQLTGKKDPDGRGVILAYFKDIFKLDAKAAMRAAWYMSHVALEDIEVQKRGVVFLMKPAFARLSDYKPSTSKMLADSLRGCVPIRMAALHLINPPTHYKILINIWKIFLGSKLRKRIILISGTDKAIIEKLSKYGLTADKVPTIFGGDVALDQEKWLEERQKEEESRKL